MRPIRTRDVVLVVVTGAASHASALRLVRNELNVIGTVVSFLPQEIADFFGLALADGGWMLLAAFALWIAFVGRAPSAIDLCLQLGVAVTFRAIGLLLHEWPDRWIHVAGLVVTEFILVGGLLLVAVFVSFALRIISSLWRKS